MFDAGLPALAYLDARAPGDAYVRIEASRRVAPIALGPFGPELLSYRLVCDALDDPRFRTAPELSFHGEQNEKTVAYLNEALTAPVAERMSLTVIGVITELVEPLAGEGRCDVVADIAQRYAVPVVCAALGVPREHWHLFTRWADECVNLRMPHELYSYLGVMIAARCWKPTDDLLTALMLAEVDGRELTQDDLIDLIATLLTAGADIARDQLAASVAALSEHPDQWELLSRHSELAAGAVAETMRYAPVRFGLMRTAVEDVELAGVRIPAGTTVHLNIASANRDPEAYGDPDRLDITRRHIAPAHTLAGQSGAHLVVTLVGEALAVLARRMPNLRRSGPVTWRAMVGTSGPATLPVVFDVGA